MKQQLITIILCFCTVYCFGTDNKSDKNNKIVEKEEHRFEKELRKDPHSAITYLDHANALAAISSEVSRAEKYYQLALKYDSASGDIYRDYGIFYCDRQSKFRDAKKMLDKASVLSPGDPEVKKYLATADHYIALQNEDDRKRDFGHTAVKQLGTNVNYIAISKFDSLRALADNPTSDYCYDKLIKRYVSDDSTLKPEEMFMLIVGYSKQKTYNPFKYSDISEMRAIAYNNADSGIKKGEELILTNPLNPSINREMMYCYRKKNDPVQGDKYMHRIQQFFNGVLYSGDGSCEKPYVSIWAKEEYNLISYLGYTATENHAMGTCAGQMAEQIDMINPKTQETETIHFNVALIYMQAIGK